MRKKKISDLPAELRPYEKCEALGPEYLSDPELLAVIIKSGTDNMSAVALAEQLLYPNGEKIGLNALLHSTTEELRQIRGIGRVKALQLICLGELARRLAEEKAEERLVIHDPASIAACFIPRMKALSEEEVHIMLFDSRDRLLRSVMVSKGTVNCAAISPREIFIQAFTARAVSFIIVHNHPSGNPEPSEADIRFSRLMDTLGKMMNIIMRDSIVIGDNNYCSLHEKGLI